MGAALGVAATTRKKPVNSAFLGHIGIPFLWLFASCVVPTTVTRISAGADAGIADSEAGGGGDATGSDTAWTCAEIPRTRLLIRQDEHELNWVSASHRGHLISLMNANNSGQRPILNY